MLEVVFEDSFFLGLFNSNSSFDLGNLNTNKANGKDTAIAINPNLI